MPKFLPISIVAKKYLKCSRTKVYSLIKTGKLIAVKSTSKKGFKVEKKNLEEFLEKKG